MHEQVESRSYNAELNGKYSISHMKHRKAFIFNGVRRVVGHLLLVALSGPLAGCESVMPDASPARMPDTSPARWSCFKLIGAHNTGEWILSLYPDGDVRFDGETVSATYFRSGAIQIWEFSDGSTMQLHPNGWVYHFYGEVTETKATGECEKRGAWE